MLDLRRFFAGVFFFISATTFAHSQSAEFPLSMHDAVSLALHNEPLLRANDEKAAALNDEAIAAGQFDDPQLMLGFINVPTNTFSLDQEDMTMTMVGIQQAFPRGHSLRERERQTKARAAAQTFRSQQAVLALIRDVRLTWLDIYYINVAKHILRENQRYIADIAKVVQSSYSVGQANQNELLQAQLESSKFSNEILQIQNQQRLLRAKLARWVGMEAAVRPLTNHLPVWPKPPALAAMQGQLIQHPVLAASNAGVQASRAQVALAQEQFKPGWMLDLSYGFRKGHMSDGSNRPDMVTAQVTIDLPIFPAQRESKRLCASTHELVASKLEHDANYLDFKQTLISAYANWQNASAIARIYQDKLLPLALQNAKASYQAYQNNRMNFAGMLQARLYAHNLQLQTLKAKVEAAKSRAILFYLQGKAESI